MQDDLVDALQTAEVADVIDRDRIAAIGHGYGGYAALMLATQSEVPLACVVSGSAPTDLPSYVAGLLSLGGAGSVEHAARVGHPVDDREQLLAASPVSRAADIAVPLLLFHGRQDARVPVYHAEALAGALEQAGWGYELTIYADEGHRYARPQNIIDCRAQCLEFLLTSLGAKPDDSASRARCQPARCQPARCQPARCQCRPGLARLSARRSSRVRPRAQAQREPWSRLRCRQARGWAGPA